MDNRHDVIRYKPGTILYAITGNFADIGTYVEIVDVTAEHMPYTHQPIYIYSVEYINNKSGCIRPITGNDVLLDNFQIVSMSNSRNGKAYIDYSTCYKRDTYSTRPVIPDIKKVIFNPPATIVLWADGTKTVVKAQEYTIPIQTGLELAKDGNGGFEWVPDIVEVPDRDVFDPEKGLAMAIAKKVLGNKGNYYDVFREWIPEDI